MAETNRPSRSSTSTRNSGPKRQHRRPAANGGSKRQRYPSDPDVQNKICLLYTSPSPRDKRQSRMPSSA